MQFFLNEGGAEQNWNPIRACRRKAYICLRATYDFELLMPLSHPAKELPMILSYTCTYAFGYVYFQSTVPIPMHCLPMLSGFWATYVFRLPMLSRYQCSWATYVFELPMPSCYLCFWSCSQASFSDACAFELPMSSVFLCFRGTNAVELLMPSGYICFWATHVFKLPMLLTTYISEPLCFQSTYFV